MAAKTTTPSPPARVCSVGGPPDLHAGRSARGPRATGFESFDYVDPKPQPSTWRGVGEEESRLTAWGAACPALAAKTATPSPSARTSPLHATAGPGLPRNIRLDVHAQRRRTRLRDRRQVRRAAPRVLPRHRAKLPRAECARALRRRRHPRRRLPDRTASCRLCASDFPV